MQLLGKPLDEQRILRIAHAYEQDTEWHKAKPPV
jgi:Asp-tRNA(Asn)/Glu-tRNA(Gln) amidotransferase A subunit family amidase